MNERALLIGGVSALSVAAGLTIGFFMAKKDLETHYANLADQEIEEARQHYARLYKRDEFTTPEAAAEELLPVVEENNRVDAAAEALLNYQGKVEPTDGDAGVIVTNVFAQARNVDENYPHMIDEEEYLANETGYDQTALTYYQGDETLVDERDEPIEATNPTVGDANLERFKSLGEDQHTIYVRNNAMKMEFEINRSMGKYAEEVLGLGQR